ncbi:MAG: GHMP kinase [Lentisphaeria bacterium]|nr:GHMP kinase [Lentisphaeria bacterium]
MKDREYYRVINASAPIRVCDIGGWTDTWFAEYGTVLNIAVYPFVEAQVFVFKRQPNVEQITVHAENYAESFSFDQEKLVVEGQHALLKAAFSWMKIPDDVAVEVHLYSSAPAGASTGTSAAVSIALIGVLDTLTPGRLSTYDVARTAQRLETEVLGLQCGIQDQLCSAFGGLNYIQMHKYPDAAVSTIHLPRNLWWELERRILVVFLGDAHVSSEVHRQVIAGFEESGPDDPRLVKLRALACQAKDALCKGDYGEFSRIMNANTEVQRSMHTSIVSAKADAIMAFAREHGAIGAKLNGAGGNGGSITFFFGASNSRRRQFSASLGEEFEGARVLPVHLSEHGLRVWDTNPQHC